ncbi:MAG: SpoIIE family protein phosphatase [Ilumatobacteraceae bacterium]
MGAPPRSTTLRPPTGLDWLPQGQDMATLIADHDWASSAIGHPSTWSNALRTAVSTCLSSNFPLLVLWGPDLVNIYNDGYRDMIGTEKHPRALGTPVADIWPEIWDTIGPMFASVVETGVATWSEHQPLLIDRHGFTEECTFTFSYSPLFDDDGSINGVLDISVETTKEIVQARRLAAIADLSSSLSLQEHATDACVAAIGALSRHSRDIVAADIMLNVDGSLVPVASNRRSLQSAGRLARVATEVLDGGARTIGQERTDFPAEHRLTPLIDGRGEVIGVFVATLNPLRPFDDSYAQFVDVVARTIGNVVERAQRRSEVVGELQYVNETLQRAMLPAVRDTPTIAARYLPAANNLSVGGDWYDIVDLPDDRRALVVGDCVGHGLYAATAMGQLRSAARALLLEGCDPAHMISSLDTFAGSIEGGACASVVCIVVDRVHERLEYCRAGHPPPLVVSPTQTRWLDASGGPVLGLDPSAERTTTSVPFVDDDVLIMYTDGLVERRGRSINEQFDELARHAEAVCRSNVTHVANSILVMMGTDSVDDDVVVVVKRLEPVD